MADIQVVTEERHDPPGRRTARVRPNDECQCLHERQQAGADKTDRHERRHGRGLNQRRQRRPEHGTRDRPFRELIEPAPEPLPSEAFQRIRQEHHAEQENPNPSD